MTDLDVHDAGLEDELASAITSELMDIPVDVMDDGNAYGNHTNNCSFMHSSILATYSTNLSIFRNKTVLLNLDFSHSIEREKVPRIWECLSQSTKAKSQLKINPV